MDQEIKSEAVSPAEYKKRGKHLMTGQKPGYQFWNFIRAACGIAGYVGMWAYFVAVLTPISEGYDPSELPINMTPMMIALAAAFVSVAFISPVLKIAIMDNKAVLQVLNETNGALNFSGLIIGGAVLKLLIYSLSFVPMLIFLSTVPNATPAAVNTLVAVTVVLFVAIWLLYNVLYGMTFTLAVKKMYGMRQAMNESRALTKGHRVQYAKLMLSMLPYDIINWFTCYIAGWYTWPIKTATYYVFYKELQNSQNQTKGRK